MSHGPTRITTLLSKAPSYALIDLATLKTLLGVTDGASDAYFKLVIPQASATVARYCGQPFVVETLLDQLWPWRDGFPWIVRGGLAVLQLARWPIVAVASVIETIDGVATTLTAGTDFVPDAATGQLTRLDAAGNPTRWRPPALAVHYAAGYPEIPFDIVDAVARIVKAAWFARTRDPMLRSQTAPGVYEAAYWFGSGPASNAALPPDITGLLDRYRVPVLG